jgi:dipeptidyl aminopeptidase/acylaminoacyl peptidase
MVSTKTGEIRPLMTGTVSAKTISWRPDGRFVSFRMKTSRDTVTQVWMVPIDGGKAEPLTQSKSKIYDYAWHPSGEQIAYIAKTPKSQREKELKKKGYGFVFYEENLKHRNLYINDLTKENKRDGTRQLTDGMTVWTFEFSPDGKKIAATISPQNLIDHRYMFRKIHILELESGDLKQLTDTPGKLGNMCFNPDGKYLAYTGALERKDHQVSQVYVVPTTGGESTNLTVPDFRGHVEWAAWKDNNTVVYLSGEATSTTLSAVSRQGGERKVILNSQENGIIFSEPSYTKGFKKVAFAGNSDRHPNEVFYWEPGNQPKQITESNPWLSNKDFGKQEVISYGARDGLNIEGILIYPLDYLGGQTYPLVVSVHGGPESHLSNGWMTTYSRPGQVLAGKSYFTFYPNYRSSTGYGVEFAAAGYGDPAGKEFDDIADGIDFLVKEGLVDKERVGLGGHSYGGYASGWFATYYTDYVRAVCMGVGISNKISSRTTTDIPYEMLYVHYGKTLEESWQENLERSPIYWAHQSKTATLIYGGKSDTRVYPAQSMELYRVMKMNDHPAVRLVQYPGEKHGNSKQPARTDVLYRIIDWYDWYVKDLKPLDGPLPPLDISEKYGLDLPEKVESFSP